MCQRVTCDPCHKPTWSGCGQHIEEALAGVPEADRCQCGTSPRVGGGFTSIFRRR